MGGGENVKNDFESKIFKSFFSKYNLKQTNDTTIR